MTAKRPKLSSGVTLIEVMVATVVLSIVSLGALGYQYHAVNQSRIAKAQKTATRTAMLLIEDWKSTGGSANYDPTALNMGFKVAETKASKFDYGDGMGATLNGKVYAITINDVPLEIVLKYKDIAHDDIAQITLRQLAVIAKFEEEQQGSSSAKAGSYSTQVTGSLIPYNPAIYLTTYIRVDASGG